MVVLDKGTLIKNCEAELDHKEFYERTSSDPAENIVDRIESEIRIRLTKNMIGEKVSYVIMEHLKKPRLPIF